MIPIYGITFLDILSFTILIPLLPLFAKRFGASDAMAGSLIGITAVCATISSPLWGMLSDRHGRKSALLGSQAFSFIGYLLLASAGALPLVFISRIVEGLGGGNLGIASSYIADVTTLEQRPQALAYATAAFGAGFVVGPIISGGLSHFGFTVPFVFAAILQAANFGLTIALLPESHQPITSKFRWRELRDQLAQPRIASVLVRRFLYIFAFTYFFTTFSLFTNDVLHTGPEISSLLLGIAGVVGAVTQIALVGPLVKRFGLQRVALAAFAAGITGYVLFGLVSSLLIFVIAIVFWAFSGSILRPAIDTRISELAPEDERGTILSLGDSLDNFSMIFAPTIGAAVVGAAPRLVGLIPALALASGFVLTARDAPERS